MPPLERESPATHVCPIRFSAPTAAFFIQEVNARNDRFQIVSVDQLPTTRRDLQMPRVRESVLAIAPDGRTFATIRPAYQHSEVWLWNAAVGQPMMMLGGNRPENILAAAFSPDGTMLAVLCHYTDRWKVLLWRAGARD